MKITEEWLKEQGWEISHYDIEFRVEIFHYATKMFGKDKAIFTDAHELKIFRDYEEPCDVYADVLIDNVDTVEKLQEALELCGVITAKKNPWHKVSEELPKEGDVCLVAFKPKEGGYMLWVLTFQDGYFNNTRALEGDYEYWMEIPEFPKED